MTPQKNSNPHAVENALTYLWLAAWLLPAAVGLLDAACWFVVAHQCTVIPWTADDQWRVCIAIGWTFLMPMLLMCFI